MILPIFTYGQPVLRRRCSVIDRDMPGLSLLIDNMWQTMYNAQGVGLAAPQIGRAIRLFLVDTIQMMEEDKKAEGIKQVFINAELISETGEPWAFEEGCLSIPAIRGDVERPDTLRIKYWDEHWESHEKTYTGLHARVIQHEYDHIEGKLFTQKLSPLKRKLMERKLKAMEKGKVKADYPIRVAGS